MCQVSLSRGKWSHFLQFLPCYQNQPVAFSGSIYSRTKEALLLLICFIFWTVLGGLAGGHRVLRRALKLSGRGTRLWGRPGPGRTLGCIFR